MTITTRALAIGLAVLFWLGVTNAGVAAQNVHPSPSEAVRKAVLEKVYDGLLARPTWLFGDDVCPLNVMPKTDLLGLKIQEYMVSCPTSSEACVKKCESEDAEACYTMALIFQQLKGLDQPVSEALFLKACKYGVASGCTNRAAAIYGVEKQTEEKKKCAVDTFEKTCELDDPWGCVMFADALASGVSRPRNYDLALKVLEKACKHGEEDDACTAGKNLAVMIDDAKAKLKK